MIGKTISRFRIVGKLGEGEMGEVGLAVDTELELKVALRPTFRGRHPIPLRLSVR